MKLFLCPVLIACCCYQASAQSLPASSDPAVTDTARKIESRMDPFPDSTFVIVEIESSFPGGTQAWLRFLTTHVEYPPKAAKKNVQGTVVVQFIVDKQGGISDVQAISGPELLRDAAVKVIRQSPRWAPAIQRGRKVKSYKKQPITFKLDG